MTKEEILSSLNVHFNTKIYSENEYIKYSDAIGQYKKRIKEQIPIVCFHYNNTNQKIRVRLIRKLQKLFCSEGYSCAVLYDGLINTSFEHGWYKIIPQNLRECIRYYEIVLSENIILLLVNDCILVQHPYYDLLVPEDKLPQNANKKKLDILYKKIIKLFS